MNSEHKRSMFAIAVPIAPLLIYYDVQMQWIQNEFLKNYVNEIEMNGIMRS